MLMFMCCIRLLHAFALPLHSQAGEDPNAPNFLVTAKQLLQTPAFLPPLAAFVASIGVSNVVSAFVEDELRASGFVSQETIDLAGAGFRTGCSTANHGLTNGLDVQQEANRRR